ncbi:MAG: DUF3857 and transglutaminase domain-containing protein [Candidatus Delongbacteria bacterium]|nr:DUF3857 and transglutaminase domain-containing protein [Candidatus Delongbacteria bacterium]
MKKLILTILVITGITFASYDIDKLISQYDNDKVYEDATTVNIFTDVNFDVEEDYSFTKHVFFLKKIVNYSGKKRYSDVTVEYDPDYESVELLTKVTIDPEGIKHEVPENQIYDLNTRDAVSSPEYINDRKKVINFPAIEPGYYLALEYKITNTRKMPVNQIVHFQESNPYIIKKLTLIYPEKLDLNIWNHEDISLDKIIENGKNILSWSINNSPLIKEEPSSPDYLISGKPLVFSFYKDWNEYSLMNLKKINEVVITDKVKELSADIIGDIKEEDEKITAVYKYLAGNYEKKNSFITQMDFTPDPMDKIIQQKYGSVRDITALFIALLRSQGIENVYPVLKLNRSYKEFPELKKMALDWFIDELEAYHEGTLVSPGNSDGVYGFTGNYENTLISPDKKELIIDYNYPETITRSRVFNYKLIDQNIELETLWSLKAADDQNNRWYKRFPEEQRKMYFAQYSLNDKAAEITSGPDFKNIDDLDKPMEISFNILYRDRIVDQGDYTYFKIMDPGLGIDVSLKDRVNDYIVKSKIYYKDTISIRTDTESRIINMDNFRKEFECGGSKAFVQLEIIYGSNNINLVRTIYIPEMTVKPEKYNEFRNFILEFKKPIYSMIFLEK